MNTNKNYKNSKNVKNNTNTFIVEIVELLNELTGKKFKPTTDSTEKSLNARLNDYSVEEIKATIRKMCKKWKGTQYEEFLRPSTLFAPTNFENYYNMEEIEDGEDKLELTRMAGIEVL